MNPLARKLLAGLSLAAATLASSLAHAAVSTDAARLNNVGVAYMNQQLNEKALERFQAAAKADPASVVPLVNEGIAYIYLRRMSEAETVLKQAAEKDPKSVRAWYALGVAQFSAGDQPGALEQFQKALALDPNDADTHYFIGTIEVGLKQYSDAIPQFEAALKLAPLHASAQFGLARALQREGKLPEAREHLARFQTITQQKIGTLMSANYGEQGRYAKVQDLFVPPSPAAPMIPVKLIPVSGAEASSIAAKGRASVCMLDVAGDGSQGFVTVSSAGVQAFRLGPKGEPEKLDAAQTGLAARGEGVACAVGDYDADGLPDLAVAMTDRVVVFHNLGHGKFEDTTSKLGIAAKTRPSGVMFVDYDHDGDLDLYVSGNAGAGGGSELWRNNGNSTFTEWTKEPALGGSGATGEAVLSDINNDRAVDLVVANATGAPTVFYNQREGAFLPKPLYAESLPPVRGIAVLDFDKDGWMDVAVTHAGAPGITLWRNRGAEGGFERVPLDVAGVNGAYGITPIDMDNDGWIDLAAVVETPKGRELHVFRNLGFDQHEAPASGKHFADVTAQTGVSGLSLGGADSAVAADVDGAGAAGLVMARADGTPLLLRNEGGSRNHALRIRLAGLADNKSAIGTKVEVFAGGNWQKFEVTGAEGYGGQGMQEIVAGLGANTTADIVRLLWPTGVPQDELDISAAKPLALTELDRRGSSCPVLFAWDGTKYTFVSDVIGAGVVGHWVSPTERNQADSDEWSKIDGSQLHARNGLLSVRFGEPMEEINYVDQLRLVAVDHPAGTDVYPDERFLSEAPFASGRTIVASAEAHLPVAATDDHGNDALPVLATRDHKYLRDFTNLSYAGFANRHALTLDLGVWTPSHPLRLFLHGYVEYFSASSMYAAWQAGIQPEPPSVEAQLPDGSWRRVVDDMGFPAGLPRTIVVDLSGKLPAGTRRIRIKTNLQIYWDQVLVDNAPRQDAVARTTEVPLDSAHLAFRGYPKQIELDTPGDLTYDYQQISRTGPFGWQRGSYTRYGDVTPLLGAKDNHFVIFGSGEDIDAEFRESALPPLPAGWKRDYFFYADGFVKDMDFYEASPFTVAQMPFHGMSTYPYPANERFPDDNGEVRYRLDWNDRMETGERLQHFQFDYKPVKEQPITEK